MKRVLFSLILFFVAFLVNAQGNLQFNQVKLVTTLETVPAGKVWKVESALTGEERYPTADLFRLMVIRFVFMRSM